MKLDPSSYKQTGFPPIQVQVCVRTEPRVIVYRSLKAAAPALLTTTTTTFTVNQPAEQVVQPCTSDRTGNHPPDFANQTQTRAVTNDIVLITHTGFDL
jgi:hypothetical protein